MHYFFFPIEHNARDFEWKFLISALSANKDHSFFIGDKKIINDFFTNSRECTYIGKNLFASFKKKKGIELLERAKRKGSSIIHLDEEGALFSKDKNTASPIFIKRHPLHLLDSSDTQLFWGDLQKSTCLTSYGQSPSCSYYIVGHPKFDLYKPPYVDIFKSNDKSPYILLNSSANTFTQEHSLSSPSGYKKKFNINYFKDPLKNLEATFADVEGDADKFLCLVKSALQISKNFPHIRILIKPHPSESTFFYEEFFKNFSNVEIVNKFQPPTSLIANALAVMTTGCTTAIEANVCKVPTFYLNIDKRLSISSKHLTKNIGKEVTSIKELESEIHRLTSSEIPAQKTSPTPRDIKERVWNIEEDKYSIDRIIEIINSTKTKESKLFSLKKLKLSFYLSRNKYSKKFEPFNINEILNLQEKIKSTLDISFNFKLHTPSLIEIYKE